MLFWVLGFFLIMGGCVSVPKKQLSEVPQSCGCKHTITRMTQEQDFSQKWNPFWWKSLQDPTLDTLIEVGLAKSPTLKQAEERFKKASQLAIQQRAKLFPELGGEGEIEAQRLSKEGMVRAFASPIPASVTDAKIGLSFDYEIDFWGKQRHLFYAARQQMQALLEEKAQAEVMVTSSIAYTYMEMQLLLYRQAVLQQIQEKKEQIQAFYERRKQHALESRGSVLPSHLQNLQAKQDLVQRKEQIDLQLHKLKTLCGMELDEELTIELKPYKGLSIAVSDNISLDLLAKRPDLRAQQALVEAAAQEIGAAKAAFYPNINLKALIGLESIFWSKLFQKQSYFGTVDPAIHLPIFTAGRIKAHLKEKEASFQEAVYTYQELILHAAQEVVDLLSQLLSLEQQQKIAKSSLEVAKKEKRWIEQRAVHALETQLARLQTEIQTLQKEQALEEINYKNQLMQILLARALGGGSYE